MTSLRSEKPDKSISSWRRYEVWTKPVIVMSIIYANMYVCVEGGGGRGSAIDNKNLATVQNWLLFNTYWQVGVCYQAT